MLASISSSVAVSGTLSKQVPLASSVNVVATTKIVIPDGSVSLRSSVKFSGSAVGTISVIRKRDINDVLPAHLVEQQFPAFIREDYPKMVEFTRAYYDYMAQTENGRIKNLRDIDEASGDYLNYMMNEYLYNASKPNFQQDFAAEDFIRYSRQFYAAKGTEESIRFIFRAQAAQEIEIDYPSEQIFKPSTAKWYQEQSVKVVMTENSIPATYFIGNYLTFKNTEGKEQTVQVSNVIDLTDKVSVYDLSTIFEIFFTTELFIDVSIGDELYGTNFQSTIIPSLSGIEIVEPGNNFRVGQIVELDGVSGSGAVAVITKVLEGGQIRNLKLIKFGKDYTTNFYLGIQPDGVFTDVGASFTVPNVSIDGETPTFTKAISDITEGFIENQSLLRSDYVLNDSGTGTPKVLDTFPFYTYPGYDGVYVSQLSNRQVFFLEENYSALLLCKIGAICTYPGKYLDQTGMPSNASVLQDNNYYQDFSYVIRSNVDIDNYRDTITTLAHPAGFKMFGEMSIDNEFYSDTTAGVSEVTSYPVMDIDFTSGVLDRRLVFTRSGTSTYVDSTGKLQSSSVNTARFDYNPTTLSPLGLLVEESRTNSIPNSTMVGAVAGTPGTQPTGWPGTWITTLNGVTPKIVGVGTEDGIQYIDWNVSGTFTGTTGTAFVVTYCLANVISALQNQTWTNSTYIKLSSGNLSNVDINLRLANYNSSLVTITTSSSSNLTVTNAALSTQRKSQTWTPTDATTAYIVPMLRIGLANGVAYNFTLRIGVPQLEQGAFATSVIPTTTAARTRGADFAVSHSLAPWFNASEGTIFIEFLNGYDTLAQRFLSLNDGTTDNIIEIISSGVGVGPYGYIVTGTTPQSAGPSTGNIAVNTSYKVALAYKNNDVEVCKNGASVYTDAIVTLPTVTRLVVGSQSSNSLVSNCWIKRITYYSRRLSSAEMQTLTT